MKDIRGCGQTDHHHLARVIECKTGTMEDSRKLRGDVILAKYIVESVKKKTEVFSCRTAEMFKQALIPLCM